MYIFFLTFKIDNITLDPDPHWSKIPDPNPNNNASGSTTLSVPSPHTLPALFLSKELILKISPLNIGFPSREICEDIYPCESTVWV